MATVLTKEGREMSSYQVPVKLEESEHGWVASNDEIQVAAAGDTKEQAITHFVAALRAMVDKFGEEMLESFRHVELVEFS